MDKHTATPWRAAYDDGSGDEYITADGKPVAVVRWGCDCCKATGPQTPQEQADRDFIIRACNSHDALLAACDALDEFQRYYETHAMEPDGMPGNEFYSGKAMAVVRQARAAIAKATRC